MPSILGAMILLFGNAFGAQATAYQLTGGFINLVPILIGNQISGDVLHNAGLGLRAGDGHGRDHGRSRSSPTSFLQRRSERWLRMSGRGRRQPARPPASTAIQRRGRGARRRGKPRAVGARGLVGRLHRSASCTSSLPLLGDVRVLAPGEPVRVRLHRRPARDPQFFVEPRLLVRRRDPDHDHRQHRAHGADRVLGPAAAAARPARRRVHHAAAVRRAADRPRVRADQHLQPRRRCRSPTPTSAAARCSSSATSSCRSRTCTGRSTRACGRSTSGR